ncbi:hypothetical protein AN216_00310, partial [Streptomyces oceani]
IFLLVGYSLQLLTPEPSLGAALRTAGWAFAVLAAATALAGMTGVLLAAVRNSGADPASPPLGPDPRAELLTAVGEAQDTWRQALLERGVLPFLREAVTDPRAALDTFDAGHLVPYEPQRTTRLGYSHPDYSSPADGTETAEPEPADHIRAKPRFASPNFSSPDYDGPNYGGPEHLPD